MNIDQYISRFQEDNNRRRKNIEGKIRADIKFLETQGKKWPKVKNPTNRNRQ